MAELDLDTSKVAAEDAATAIVAYLRDNGYLA